ncbi:hypothetical protein M426DRAFT_260083 [Hypoxylon sp. CI-4A]|nr:hypothetical protein M426DRAFT_260083 [Hypoxylon sp. CI-4A]
MSEAYQATNPKDKVFALQSLLHGYAGRLINLDYEECCEAVFKRVTARCFNAITGLYLTQTFKFWFESPLSTEEPGGPSWVLDLAYTDAGFCGDKSTRDTRDKVTLDGFISQNKVPRLQLEHGMDIVPFCTPTVLHCTGRCIDQVHRIASFPRLSDTTTQTAFTTLVWLSLQIFNARESLLGLPITREFGDIENTDFLSLTKFFMMQERWPEDQEELNRLATIRGEELVGKPIFITKRGVVGIATAAIKPGDFLSLLHSSPTYLILRERKDRKDGERQHRIVARAAVNDKLLHEMKDMKAFIESTSSQHFQII